MAELTDECEYTSDLDQTTLEKAKQELNEQEKERDGSIKALRELMKREKWIRCPLGTRFLLKYLRVQKFSQLGARARLEHYFTSREENPLWFANKDPQDKKIQELLKSGFILRLPRTDENGRTYMMSRPGQVDLDKIKKELGGVETVFRTFTTVLDWIMMDERAQVNGLVIIIDQTGFTMAQKTQVYTVENLRRMTSIMQNSYPFRVKQFHFYNPPAFFEALFTIVKGFLKQKFRERITIHKNNMVSLYEAFDKSVLPEEYLPDEYTGPNSGSVKSITDYMRESLCKPEVREYIRALSTYGVDLKQKPSEAEPVASFRKLNVD